VLQVKDISFSYSKTSILEHIDFSVQQGEHIAIIGESGSGKSTLLKLIYGEYDLDAGAIFWKDTAILGPKYNLVVGYDFMKHVTQEFDLMPYISVEENIGKFLSRFYPEEKQKRTEELIQVVELKDYATTKVQYLSGGQKQRVALARALAKAPEILLLDEPFSHIDNFKKQSLRRNIFGYLKDNHITCLVATHDKNDVLGFADQMLVLHQKRIIKKGTPKAVYAQPELPLVASFFGEFSVINGKIYYAHQLKIVENSQFKAIVKQSYYNGQNWLVDAEYDSATIFIEHHLAIAKDQLICFEICD